MNPVDGVEGDEVGATPAQLDADDLDAKTNQPRLTGPGARAAKIAAEPKTDAGTLGRERRSR